jgi:8-oxo-dGTP pyrophosphatase MutT (NUDIX family)
MSRENLITKLEAYKPMDSDESDSLGYALSFIKAHEDCFDRTQTAGHITGSAWIVNQSWDKVLLIHHKKLNKWLQPGGHCDGSTDVIGTAFREAQEETGITPKLISEEIFDVAAHNIPAKGDEPSHIHYDMRYLFEANDTLPLVMEEGKANDIRWVPLEELEALVGDNDTFKGTLMRMLDKTLWLIQNTKMAAAS